MKLEPPLSNLIQRCATICESECCGIDAYDFSPIHIASYLIMYRGKIDENEIDELNIQLENLKQNYGSNGASSKGIEIEEMNQMFNGKEIDDLVKNLRNNIQISIKLIEQVEVSEE